MILEKNGKEQIVKEASKMTVMQENAYKLPRIACFTGKRSSEQLSYLINYNCVHITYIFINKGLKYTRLKVLTF